MKSLWVKIFGTKEQQAAEEAEVQAAEAKSGEVQTVNVQENGTEIAGMVNIHNDEEENEAAGEDMDAEA